MEKISAVYIDNSKVFTTFLPVYIVIEEDDFKIRIGRTLLNSQKVKGFKLRVEGMKQNVYLTIKTPRKVFEFRDIDNNYVKILKTFEKEYKTRKPKKEEKNVNDSIYKSAISAASSANKQNSNKIILEKQVQENVEIKEKEIKTIKVEKFIPRFVKDEK